MRPRFLFIFLLVCLSSLLNAQFVLYENFEKYTYPNKDQYNLKNNVKTVRTRYYNATTDENGEVKTGTRVGSSAGFEYLSFDKLGRILLEGNFYKDSILDAKMTYTYNDVKKTLTVVRSYLNGKEDYRLIYTYNPAKMQIAVEEKHAVYPAINKSFVMQYDKDSAIETISYFNKSHELVSSFRFIRNDTANTVSRQELLYEQPLAILSFTIIQHPVTWQNANGILHQEIWKFPTFMNMMTPAMQFPTL